MKIAYPSTTFSGLHSLCSQGMHPLACGSNQKGQAQTSSKICFSKSSFARRSKNSKTFKNNVIVTEIVIYKNQGDCSGLLFWSLVRKILLWANSLLRLILDSVRNTKGLAIPLCLNISMMSSISRVLIFQVGEPWIWRHILIIGEKKPSYKWHPHLQFTEYLVW